MRILELEEVQEDQMFSIPEPTCELYDLREAEQFWRDHKDSIYVITDDNDKELGDFP